MFVDNVRYPIDPIKINEGTTNVTGNIYPAFDLYVRMTHKSSNIAPLDIHYFDNLAKYFVLMYQQVKNY